MVSWMLLTFALLTAEGEGTSSASAVREAELARYFVNRNAQDNGDHEVHRLGCRYTPAEKNRIDLGFFGRCQEALREARKHFRQIDGCYHCSRECHTR